jgi:hypothetical protein
MTPEDRFRAYIDAFNRSDYEALCRFYAPDVRLVIGNGTELIGRDAIVDFYKPVKAATRRTIEVVQCFHDGNVLAAELESEFLALEDLPAFVAGPMHKGDRRYLNSLVLYDFEGDHYTRIRAAILKREYRPVAAAA